MIKTYGLAKLAAQKMINENFLIFDTETTGLGVDDEIIELGIIDCRGNVLYHSLFCPEKEMDEAASKVSGITNEMLQDKPLFKDEFHKIASIMSGRGVIAFNEEFDESMFYQTAARYGFGPELVAPIFANAYCAMSLYDIYIGYERTKLEYACAVEGVEAVQDHRAVGDCQMTLEMIQSVADRSKKPNLLLYGETKAKATGKTLEEVMDGKVLGFKGKWYDPSYVELFKEGKSIKEIVDMKKVLSKTVEDAIIQAYKSGALDNIDSLIQPQYVDGILNVINQPSWNGKLTPVKNEMPEDCTWICIQAVIAKNHKGLYNDRHENRPLDEVISKAKDSVLVNSLAQNKGEFTKENKSQFQER